METNFGTKLTHLGTELKSGQVGRPKIAPIVMSAAYFFDEPNNLEASLRHEIADYNYGRGGNATNDCAREILTAIEGGAAAQVFATGMGGISLTLMSLLSAGDHIILSSIVFGGTYNLLINKLQKKYGVEVSIVDFRTENLEGYFKPNTKAVYMETISNPMLDVVDMRKVAETAHKHNALLIVDNTFATPVVCQPLSLGADLVVYSATKFMNGHSDILAGAVIGKDAGIMAQIEEDGHVFGPTMSPFDAFLFTRSLRTLELRVRQHSLNAMQLARYFEANPKVVDVRYPGLESSPYHKIAQAQFNNGLYGGMVSIDVGSYEKAKEVIRNFKLVKLVASLGCLTTTVSDTRTSHSGMKAEERAKAGIGDGVLRVSVGLDNAEDVIADFAQALEKI
ncbi:MAG: aminotransferase class I/II-fold pyridoxal phosphate-dependent enzyme [Peptococcaceae bacterium]|nr:aminotransferase class I/II-fold pyridoxal phosphate-dependent enzyme [Peptococcaceae bacterium]